MAVPVASSGSRKRFASKPIRSTNGELASSSMATSISRAWSCEPSHR